MLRFFGWTARSADPMSLNTDPLVRTSDWSVPTNFVGSSPLAATRLTTMICTGERPVRATSPHEAAAAAMASVRIRKLRRIPVLLLPLQLDDPGRHENQQLLIDGAVHVALEEPFDQRNRAEPRRPILLRLLVGHEHAADDRRLSVGDEHGRDRALGVDGRRAVDRAREVRLAVLQVDQHD